MKHAPDSPSLTPGSPPDARRVLAIAAHPDDIESWCAGTLALLHDAGAAVGLVLVTAGECGSDDPAATRGAVAARREAEAREAAQLLGIAEMTVLGYPDGGVENSAALRGDLVAAIRRFRPEVVFTHDPEHPSPPYLSHRDHREVGRAALDAIYPLARDRLALPEHPASELPPHVVHQVWLFASTAASVAIDISAGFERKLAARLAHRSQTSDPAALRESWQQRAAQIGRAAGVPLAEAFTAVEAG
jgi:LmbE family N-acetylglucosaminyl deacetylase